MTFHKSALFVTWRGRSNASFYFPVGRLCELQDDAGNTVYEFAYIEGVHDAEKDGFRPFLEFPNLDRVYRSREIFPLFSNRLMPKSRPDYVQYVERLGLSHKTVQPMELLGRSMGARATDSVELFPLPVKLTSSGRYATYFLLRGIRHRTPEQQTRIDALTAGEKLAACPNPANAFDPHAIELHTADGYLVGHLPSYLAEDACRLCHECKGLDVSVDRVNPPPAPVQHRVLCRLETCWPEGFEPFSTPRYHTLSEHATPLNPAELMTV